MVAIDGLDVLGTDLAIALLISSFVLIGEKQILYKQKLPHKVCGARTVKR
jgi:hypothetical protein